MIHFYLLVWIPIHPTTTATACSNERAAGHLFLHSTNLFGALPLYRLGLGSGH